MMNTHCIMGTALNEIIVGIDPPETGSSPTDQILNS